MACERKARFAAMAAEKSGVTATSNRLAHLSASLASRFDRTLDRAGQATAPAAQVVLAAADGLRANKNAGRAVTGATLAAGLLLPPVRTARRVVRQIDRVSSVAGDLAGTISKTEPAGQLWREKRTLFFFKSKVPVTLWRSRLTEVLNRQDLPGARRFSGQDVVSSGGVMFRSGDKTWHRGTVVVNTGQGQRIVIHLQSLSLPGTHYYFNQPLTDEQAVGVATGQLQAEAVSGLAGQVSATEGLCPGWADLKHNLIKTRLYWGSSDNEGQE